MKIEKIKEIADAVLYEGYLLYPYRQSALKNQQRWTYGVVYPRQYSESDGRVEPWSVRTECLFEPHRNSVSSTFDIAVRFLHLWTCTLEPAQRGGGISRRVGDSREYAVNPCWQEAMPREIWVHDITLYDLLISPVKKEIYFPAQWLVEPVNEMEDGRIVREQQEIRGVLTIAAEDVETRLCQISVTIENITPAVREKTDSYQAILPACFISTHTILQLKHGAFVSLLDPPDEFKVFADRCYNDRTWPVLVGWAGERDAMLSSPIILYDYPRIAPESVGTFFDGTEIDEMLTLRILTLSDEEKQELRQGDRRGRELLERTEQLTPEQMMQLHGVIREMRPAASEPYQRPSDWELMPPVQVQARGGDDVRVGDHVRLHPRVRADAFDVILKGQLAQVEEIKQDVDGRTYLVVTIDIDPGREQFDERVMPGHRFFFFPEEAELVNTDRSDMRSGRDV